MFITMFSRVLLIHHLCLWPMFGRNHIRENMLPTLLLGSRLPSFGQPQDVLIMCMVIATSSAPSSRCHRWRKRRLPPLLDAANFLHTCDSTTFALSSCVHKQYVCPVT